MSKIEWCDKTINPIGGCSHISGGCKNCYAERLASTRLNHIDRYKGITSKGRWNGKTFFHKAELEKPYHWKKPQRIFIGSMGDLFHESVPFEWIDKIWCMMDNSDLSRHTFMILTKRPKRMREYIEGSPYNDFILNNVWLGVTTEDKETADERIQILKGIPATKHFISVEPMLSPVSITNFNKLDWVICGAETGRNKRPMDMEWARSLRDQCKEAGVPFFFKKDSRGLYSLDMPREFPKEI